MRSREGLCGGKGHAYGTGCRSRSVRLDLARSGAGLRLGALAWLALCGAAVLLSLSEMASLHESTEVLLHISSTSPHCS